MAEWLELWTPDHKVQGLNPAGGRIQLMIVRPFVAQNASSSPLHHVHMT